MKSTLFNFKTLAFIAAAFIAGVLFMIVIFHSKISANSSNDESNPAVDFLRQNNTKYKFISPLLSSDGQNENLKWYPAERKLKTDLQTEIDKTPDIQVGLHFINLTNGGWFGIKGSDQFVPASLLKLPMLISYYKLRETDPGLFDEKITYTGSNFDKQQNLGTGNITPGQTYTVKQLMDTMIKDSDNNALELLYQYKQDSLKEIFNDLQLPLPDSREAIAQNNYVSPRGVARFLLVLYNASYLSRNDSEDALNLLSQTNFKDGLVAGVDPNTVVSHKFGEREVAGAGGYKELHECGIIYEPKAPYLLCVMTKGNDFDKQKAIIKNLSKITFDEVSAFGGAQ